MRMPCANPTYPPIQNSKFIIHLALFRAYYRVKKRLFLWWVKKIVGKFSCIMLIINLLEF